MTVTVNLHLALFPEGSVDDTNTVVVPIFTLMGRRPPIAHEAGEDSMRGKYPELSGNMVPIETYNDVMRLIRRIDHQCIVCQIVRHSAPSDADPTTHIINLAFLYSQGQRSRLIWLVGRLP